MPTIHSIGRESQTFAHPSQQFSNKKITAVRIFLVIFLSFFLAPQAIKAQSDPPKNIILLIGDGMGFEQVKVASIYKSGTENSLTMQSAPYQGQVTTYAADNAVTDSAASGTAMATGQKANNGVISMAYPGDGSELKTVLEFYQDRCKNSGLVASSYITHATPAVFAAHEPSRNNKSEIAADYLNQTKPNILLGGGGNGLTVSDAQNAYYEVVQSRTELQAPLIAGAQYVSGQFGSDNMAYEYDYFQGSTTFYDTNPHLHEMAAAALENLEQDPDGFFLMIEGSRIDHAGHGNNLERNIFETLEFDKTLETVLDWADGRDDTLIIVTADHETGGLALVTNNGVGQFPTVTWSTGSHTDVNVPIYAWGPNASTISGTIDNTDIFDIMIANAPSSGACAPTTFSFQDGVSPTTGYAGTEDTTISEDESESNFGTNQDCFVDGNDPQDSGDDKSVLLRWDTSAVPPGETVYSAKITLRVTNVSDDTYQLYRLKRPWQEVQATWQNWSGDNAWQVGGAKGTLDRDSTILGQFSAAGTGDQTITLNSDGLAIVQSWIDDPNSNLGLIIANNSNGDGIDFYCREVSTAAYRPQLTIQYGGIPPVDLLDWIWSGSVTASSARVNARLKENPTEVRLALSETPDFSSPLYFSPDTTTNTGAGVTISIPISGLDPLTQYYYAVEADGQLDSENQGTFQTFSDDPFSFTFAFAGDADLGSNATVFDDVREENALFFLSPGDLMYSDINTNDIDLYRNAYSQTLSASRQSALYRSLPIAYVWDDHDYSNNNSDKTAVSREAARLAYREIVPSYPLDAGSGNAPIYQSFSVGRAYFIMTDLRSEKDVPGNTNDSSRSMMGSTQKAWFKDELLYAKNNFFAPIFWVSSMPWIASAENNEDHWGGYNAERVEIANFIKDNLIQDVFILAADAHMIALDDGTNSDYATGGGAAMPVFHGAALNRSGSIKGGPYSNGAIPNPSSNIGQYALVTVTDNDGLSIDITYAGKQQTNSVVLAPQAVNDTTTQISWEKTILVPTAVDLLRFQGQSRSIEWISPIRMAGALFILIILSFILVQLRRRLEKDIN